MPHITSHARLLSATFLMLAVIVCLAKHATAQVVCQTTSGWQSPTAAPAGPYVAATGQNIAFDGGGSWSFEGPIIYYYWDFGDGTYGTGPNPSHQYTVEGAYTVTLTVCDDLWNCASSESYATAGAVNVPARIHFDELPNNTIVADQYLSAYGVRFSTDNAFYPVRTWNDCGFCSTTSPPNFIEAGYNNQGQMIVQFSQPVGNLTFYIVGVDVFFDQFAVIDVYRNGSLYASYPVYGNGRTTVGFTLGTMDNISKVVVRSITDPYGLGYDDFTFNVSSDIKITSGRVGGYLNGTTQNALLGADIALQATPLPGGFAGGTYSWSFTGPYQVLTSTNSSSITIRSTAVSSDPGVGPITATVSYSKNGLTATGSVTINSKVPTVTGFYGEQYSDLVSTPYQCGNEPGEGLWRYRLGCTGAGISFTAGIQDEPVLSNPAQSGIKLVQAVSTFRKWMSMGRVCRTRRTEESNVNSGWQLDTEDPYGDNWITLTGESRNLFMFTFDSPDEALPYFDYYFMDALYIDDRFEMYLVYFTGDRKQPLIQRPLAKVPWNWGGLVVFDSDGHHIRYSNAVPGTRMSVATNSMVTMQGNVNGDPDVPCPGDGPLSTNRSDSSRELVKYYYLDILGRSPDSVGWNNWTSNISQCIFEWNCLRIARPNVGVQFFWGDEFRQQIAQIDPVMASGTGADYNRRFVYWCYRKLLRREPDQGGWDNWTNTLNATGDYNAVVFGFIYSDEYRTRQFQ